MISTLQFPKSIVPQPNGDGRFLWTVDSFYRAVDAGVFNEPKRIELFRGDLWEKERVNPPHALSVDTIARLLRMHFEPSLRVREQKPLSVSNSSEPIPDVLLVASLIYQKEGRHPIPAEVALLIEVVNTTIQRDTVEKMYLYAEAGVAEYWVVLLGKRQLRVFRRPSVEGYLYDVTYSENDNISPLFAPETSFAVAELLPAGKETEKIP